MLKGALVILLALTAFVPLAFWIQRHSAHHDIAPRDAAQVFAVPSECRPEPGERTAYLAGLLLLPAAIFGFSRLVTLVRPTCRLNAYWLCASGYILLAALLIWFCAIAASGDKDDAGNGFYHIRYNFFREHPWALLLLPCLVGLSFRKRPAGQTSRWWFFPMALVVAIVPLAASIFSSAWPYAGKWHFNAVFDSVVRLHLGHCLLVDSTSQYGLYAWFLNPLFHAVGLSVARFTLVMGLLSAFSYFMIGLFLKQMIGRPILAAVGLIATLFGGWMLFLTVEGPHRGQYLDLYFQYVPLRLLCPALLLGLAGYWLRTPTRILSRTIWLALACGLLWNLDSGLPALAAWSLLLVFIETEPDRPTGRMGRLLEQATTGCLAIAAILAIHAGSTYCSTGAWPNYTLLFRSQLIFYAYGFGMLPMPWPGTWMVVVGIYLLGLTYAALAHAGTRPDLRARALFLLSMLGMLLFSYYQGRSHRAVLILAWWPAFPVLTILLDALFDRIANPECARFPAALLACLPAAILLGSVASFCERLPEVGAYAGKQIASVMHGTPSETDNTAQVIRSQTSPGQPVWIISPREAAIHLACGRPQIAPCSFNELLLMADYPPLARKLAENPAAFIWVDKIELEGALSVHQGMQFVAELLAHSYEPIAVGRHGWLFRRRPGAGEYTTLTAQHLAKP